MFALAFADLQLFVRVAALGNLSAVARERDVPVSQVSRALARIEKQCGARLVHRSTHALALTVEGETFLAYCQRLTATLDELAGEFADSTSAASGLVRVASSTVMAQYHLLPSLVTLSRRHPKLRVEMLLSDGLADMAREGIDIAIRTGDNLPETMVARRLGVIARGLYAAPDYLASWGTPQQPQDLARHRLVTNTVPFANRWPFIVDGKTITVLADGFWHCNDAGVLANMVLQGLGIGRMSTLVAGPMVRQGRLVPLLVDSHVMQPVPIYAVFAATRERLPKIRACVDHWVDWFAQAELD